MQCCFCILLLDTIDSQAHPYLKGEGLVLMNVNMINCRMRSIFADVLENIIQPPHFPDEDVLDCRAWEAAGKDSSVHSQG